VASGARKSVPSTGGHAATAATSPLFGARVAEVVPRAMADMGRAVEQRDFEAFARSRCATAQLPRLPAWTRTRPSSTSTTRAGRRCGAVEAVNARAGKAVARTSFDAGPNAVVYYLAENEAAVAGVFRDCCRSGGVGWAGIKEEDAGLWMSSERDLRLG